MAAAGTLKTILSKLGLAGAAGAAGAMAMDAVGGETISKLENTSDDMKKEAAKGTKNMPMPNSSGNIESGSMAKTQSSAIKNNKTSNSVSRLKPTKSSSKIFDAQDRAILGMSGIKIDTQSSRWSVKNERGELISRAEATSALDASPFTVINKNIAILYDRVSQNRSEIIELKSQMATGFYEVTVNILKQSISVKNEIRKEISLLKDDIMDTNDSIEDFKDKWLLDQQERDLENQGKQFGSIKEDSGITKRKSEGWFLPFAAFILPIILGWMKENLSEPVKKAIVAIGAVAAGAAAIAKVINMIRSAQTALGLADAALTGGGAVAGGVSVGAAAAAAAVTAGIGLAFEASLDQAQEKAVNDLINLPDTLKGNTDLRTALNASNGKWVKKKLESTPEGKARLEKLYKFETKVKKEKESRDAYYARLEAAERAKRDAKRGATPAPAESPEMQVEEVVVTASKPSPAGTKSDNINVKSGPSETLINFLKQKENPALAKNKGTSKAFWDVKQFSNGYGTKAKNENEIITEAEADKRLREEVSTFYQYVVNYGKQKGYNWNQGKIDALTSFVYNLGVGSLDQLTNKGKRSDAEIMNALPLYNKAGGKVSTGLQKRRLSELSMFAGNSEKGNMQVASAPPAPAAPSPPSAPAPKQMASAQAPTPRQQPNMQVASSGQRNYAMSPAAPASPEDNYAVYFGTSLPNVSSPSLYG